MDEVTTIPFQAESSALPCPLPSLEEIRAATDVLQNYSGSRVVRCNEHYVVKYGVSVSLTEGTNAIFVHKLGTVPVPRVYALFTQPGKNGTSVNYIIMENVRGISLDKAWKQLDATAKDHVITQLGKHVQSLRSAPSPSPPYFGLVGRRPLEDGIFWTAPKANLPDSPRRGPFDNEEDFNEALVLAYLYHVKVSQKGEYLRETLPRVLQNHRPVFSHGDIQPKNIIVKEDKPIMIVDWEAAGWYPEYWEYARAMFACGRWDDDWCRYVGKAVPEYLNEFAWYNFICESFFC